MIAHKQAFHLAGIRVIGGVQRSKRAAAGDLTIYARKEKCPARWRVVTWKRSEFLVEILETQIHAKSARVVAKNLPHGSQFLGGHGGKQFDKG